MCVVCVLLSILAVCFENGFDVTLCVLSLSSLLQCVQKAMYVWQMVPAPRRVEWKCVITAITAQCVMTSGMNWRPEWSADNWDTIQKVRHT